MDLVAGMEECPGCGQPLRRAAPPPPPPPAGRPDPIAAAMASVAASGRADAPPKKERNWLKIAAYLFVAQFVLGWGCNGILALMKPSPKASGGDSGEKDAASVQESAPAPGGGGSDERALLQVQDVYAPISYAQTMAPLMGVIAEKGYGNVKADDFKPAYLVSTAKGSGGVQISAQVLFTDTALMQSPATYVPMSLMQCLRRANDDPQIQGIVVDPGKPGEVVLDKGGITVLLDRLKSQGRADPDRPFAVMRLMNRGEGSSEQ